MGWKKVKEHYRIEHLVQVTEDGVCIGSSYIHNIIVIDKKKGVIKGGKDHSPNPDLNRYIIEMKRDPATLLRLLNEPDVFANSITVYTYDDKGVVKKQCETLGWPNCTHDGKIMYENQFFTDPSLALGEAIYNSTKLAEFYRRRVAEIREELEKFEGRFNEVMANLPPMKKSRRSQSAQSTARQRRSVDAEH